MSKLQVLIITSYVSDKSLDLALALGVRVYANQKGFRCFVADKRSLSVLLRNIKGSTALLQARTCYNLLSPEESAVFFSPENPEGSTPERLETVAGAISAFEILKARKASPVAVAAV